MFYDKKGIFPLDSPDVKEAVGRSLSEGGPISKFVCINKHWQFMFSLDLKIEKIRELYFKLY